MENDHIEIDADRQALEQAKETARAKMLADPTPEAVAGFERAREAIDKYNSASRQPDIRVFKNRVKVVAFLQGQGYKVKKSKFYADCKVGLCRMAADGSITEDEVNRYVRRVGLQLLEKRASDPASEMLARKNEKEVERLEEQISKLRREREIIEGKYLDRGTVEMEVAGKCAVLEAGIRHLLHTRLADWLDLVAASGMAAAMDAAQQDLNALFNEFASLDGFEVIINKGGY